MTTTSRARQKSADEIRTDAPFCACAAHGNAPEAKAAEATAIDRYDRSPEKQRATLNVVGTTHIDPVWLWQWQEGFQAFKATTRSALARIDKWDDFTFTSSSLVSYWEMLEHNEPEMFKECQRRAREGRLQIVGGMWVEPDCNIPSGESFVRQTL